MNPYFGIAAGAGANQYLKLDENARANRKDERDTALSERQLKTADIQLEQGQMAIDKLRQKEELGRLYRNAATGDPDALNQVMGRYNSNTGVFGDGLKVVPQGDRYDFADAKGTVVRSIPNDPQALRPLLQQAYLNELSYLDDNAMYKGMEHSQRERQLGSQEKYQQGILDWHEKQASRPQFMQDGTGRVLAISPEGKLVGTYGSARPVVGAGGAGAQLGQLLGPTTDGKGLIYNTPSGLAVKPVPDNVDVNQLFPKATGIRPQLNPSDTKEYRSALMELGPRPEPKRGWFGQDDSRGEKWDAVRSNIDRIYGIAPQQNAMPPIMQMPAPK